MLIYIILKLNLKFMFKILTKNSILYIGTVGLLSLLAITYFLPAKADTYNSTFTSDVTSTIQWFASIPTSSHYTLINNNDCYFGGDYVYTTTTGAVDKYTSDISSIPNGAKITAIGISGCGVTHLPGSSSSTMDVFYTYNNTTSTPTYFELLESFTSSTSSSIPWNNLNYIKSPTSSFIFGINFDYGSQGARLYNLQPNFIYSKLLQATNMSIQRLSSTSLSISWDDNTSAEENYVIQRTTSTPFSGWETVSYLDANSTSTIDTGLVSDKVYCYRVAPKNFAATGDYSDVVCKATATEFPIWGINLTATSTPGGYVRLEWTNFGSNKDGYKIERSSDGKSYVTLATVGFTSTKYDDLEVSSGNTYYYRVRPFNDYGIQGASSDTDETITLP